MLPVYSYLYVAFCHAGAVVKESGRLACSIEHKTIRKRLLCLLPWFSKPAVCICIMCCFSRNSEKKMVFPPAACNCHSVCGVRSGEFHSYTICILFVACRHRRCHLDLSRSTVDDHRSVGWMTKGRYAQEKCTPHDQSKGEAEWDWPPRPNLGLAFCVWGGTPARFSLVWHCEGGGHTEVG